MGSRNSKEATGCKGVREGKQGRRLEVRPGEVETA